MEYSLESCLKRQPTQTLLWILENCGEDALECCIADLVARILKDRQP